MSLSVESPAFHENALIPTEYSCEGVDRSPPLSWQGAPENTKSFALIMDDPDAPNGTFVHWILFNIPADKAELEANASIPKGAVSGTNSWGKTGYGGPCPPSGTHHYHFKLYALDTELSLDETANKQDVLDAMKNHILDESVLIGLYQKGS